MTGGLTAWSSVGAPEFTAFLDATITRFSAGAPRRLTDAMRHGVLAGGKRLRPYLVLESAALLGVSGEGPRAVAAAIEFVHCYSLIHDDLPAMDDDDVRRGQPTVHRAFDEATAILAGDALLTLAFEIVAGQPYLAPSAKSRVLTALARAAGTSGMVGGQMLDLAAEGRFAGASEASSAVPDVAGIERLQGMKTGALIVFCAQAGALMRTRPARADLEALGAYGRALGLAFQIRDDLIDVEVDAATAGKATGKDAAHGKATFVGLLGVDGARRRLEQATQEGLAALAPYSSRAAPLAEVLAFNRGRTS
jgi:farnesyl diphosphate synthase